MGRGKHKGKKRNDCRYLQVNTCLGLRLLVLESEKRHLEFRSFQLVATHTHIHTQKQQQQSGDTCVDLITKHKSCAVVVLDGM